MRNFSRDKRRIEEMKKKRHEEKQLKKLNRSAAAALPQAPAEPPVSDPNPGPTE